MEFWHKFDRLINPIHLLGIRSYVRTKFFTYTFHFAMVLMVGAILIGLGVVSLDNTSPTEIGKYLFLTFSSIQYAIIALVFPAFSCTSIISEKEGKTFDLLITANLSAQEIVLGKFLSAFTHGFLFLISSLPIAMISFLFGGITPTLIFITYITLFVYASIIIMICLALSSVYKSITRAIIASYICVFLLSSICIPMLVALADDYLYRSEITRFFQSLGGVHSANGILTLYIVPIFVYFCFMFFPFIVARNSLRVTSNNHSTSFRVFFLFFVMGSAIIFWSYYSVNTYFSGLTTLLEEHTVVVSAFFYAIVGFLSLIGAFAFASEDPVPQKFVTKRLTDFFASKKWLRIFNFKIFAPLVRPSSYMGAMFVTILCLVCLVIHGLLFYFVITNRFAYLSLRYTYNSNMLYYTIAPALVIFSFVYFISMFACFLSFLISSRNWRRALLLLFLLFVIIFLPIYTIVQLEWYRSFEVSIFNLQYLSPSMCYFVSWLPQNDLVKQGFYRHNFFIKNIPIHYLQIIIYSTFGLILHFVNRKKYKERLAKLQKQEQKILDLKPVKKEEKQEQQILDLKPVKKEEKNDSDS